MTDGAGLNRRRLLVGTALIGATAAAAGDAHPPAAKEGTFNSTLPWEEGSAANPREAADPRGYRFFGPDEAAFIEAAVNRIIPADATGPSAVEAGVPIFLDRQLGGPFGQGDHYYLQGPWPEGAKTQGYQSRFSPADLYRHAIKAVDGWCRDKHGHPFRDLAPDAQDSALKACESGDAKLDGVSAKTWFTLFLTNVQEGYWSDPIYGGNRDMGGWRMIGFPGAHYDYSEWIDRPGQKWPHPPVGLKGRREWSEA